jgi:hypothetical protein
LELRWDLELGICDFPTKSPLRIAGYVHELQ